MAAEQMKKVASHLTCPVCYELYKEPKYLPCYHSYCEQCLVKLQKAGSDKLYKLYKLLVYADGGKAFLFQTNSTNRKF